MRNGHVFVMLGAQVRVLIQSITVTLMKTWLENDGVYFDKSDFF